MNGHLDELARGLAPILAFFLICQPIRNHPTIGVGRRLGHVNEVEVKWHTLNAIAREVSVQRLKQTSSEWVQAHSLAANYHARHFRAKQILHVERLAGSFAELRYHLYQAGRLGELEAAYPEAGVSPMATLLIPPDEIQNLSPDFLIGHDRQSGGYAKALQKRVFPQSKRVHFIHTAPEEIEPSKPSRSGTAAKRGEERVKEQKDQAKDAVLIVGVGPRLAREFGNHVHGAGYAPVHELNPGFDLDDETPDVAAPVTLPPGVVCLVLGRADDYELKGLDLAAESMGAVADSWKPMVLPKLVVRGAPEGKGDELFKKLRGDIHSKRPLPITVREFSDNLEAIQNDLRGASLLLMPSCVEGFGLVAMEAICRGVPVLVSEQSGIAEILPHGARDNILPTRPDALTPLDAEWTKTWAEAIARILNGRDTAFAAARKLKLEMAAKYTWRDAIRGFLKALGVPTP